MALLSKYKYGLIDFVNLKKLRNFTVEILESLEYQPSMKVLEIGPARREDALNSNIFAKYPNWFFDFEKHVKSMGATYHSLDIDGTARPTFIGSVSDTKLKIQKKSYDEIIAFDVLEHTEDLVSAFRNFRKWLSPSGVLRIISPWDLRFHGPRPDCWRISDDGYRYLLGVEFDNIEFHYLSQRTRPLHPLGIYVKAIKN